MKGLFLCLVCMALSLSTHALDIKPCRSLLEQNIRLVLKQDYDSALSLCQSEIQRHPRLPAGYFFKIAVLESRMIDYECLDGEKEFYMLSGQLNRLVDSLLGVSDLAWLHYFKGASAVIVGLHRFRFSQPFSGSKTVFDGMRDLQTAFSMDSTLFDALLYLGLGRYVKNRLISWLAFWSQETDSSAMELLERCAAQSLFSREISRQVLVGLYTRETNYETAEKMAISFMTIYPDCRAIYWLLARIYELDKQPEKALNVYVRLDSLVQQIPLSAPYNHVMLCLKQAELFDVLGRLEDCRRFCRRGLEFQKIAEEDIRLRDIFLKLRHMEKKISKGKDYERKKMED